jgi:membrane protease subunit HflC
VILLVTAIAVSGIIFFQVRETESALVTTFGKPAQAAITEPGFYFRWPVPIQRVHKFDSRMRVMDADLSEITTKGNIPIIIDSYLVWNISDPLNFFTSLKTFKEAEKQLQSQINDTASKVIGKHEFSEFINSDSSKIKLDLIQDEMLQTIQASIKEAGYGIEIKACGIKRLNISKNTTEEVFRRMQAERERRTQAIISQGNAEATRIKADADFKKVELLAAAEARAKAIRGQGDAEAAKFYKMLEEDPELAMFLRDIDALKKILQNRSTIVLDGNSEPLKLLKEMPKLEPK